MKIDYEIDIKDFTINAVISYNLTDDGIGAYEFHGVTGFDSKPGCEITSISVTSVYYKGVNIYPRFKKIFKTALWKRSDDILLTIKNYENE
jgi:hypothetical protein